MIGIYRFKPKKDQVIRALAYWLTKRGVSANHVTFLGLIFGVMAACSIGTGFFTAGLMLIALSVFADLLDGTVARISGADSLQGKLVDALSDRIVEISWVGALCCNKMLPWWGWLMPIGSIGLLLARYFALRRNLDTSFVPVTRFERVTAVIGVILIPWRWISDSFYLLIVGGTAFSILLILFTLQHRSHTENKGYLKELAVKARPL